MSSGDLHEDLSFDNISQIKTPGLLGSARSEACSNEAVSVSPKSSIDNQDSLTAQLLLGQRQNLFTKDSLPTASSPAASSPISTVSENEGSTKTQRGKSNLEPTNGSTVTLEEPLLGAETILDLDVNSTQQYSSPVTEEAEQVHASSSADPSFVTAPPELSSIRTSPPAISTSTSNALPDNASFTGSDPAQAPSRSLSDDESQSPSQDSGAPSGPAVPVGLHLPHSMIHHASGADSTLHHSSSQPATSSATSSLDAAADQSPVTTLRGGAAGTDLGKEVEDCTGQAGSSSSSAAAEATAGTDLALDTDAHTSTNLQAGSQPTAGSDQHASTRPEDANNPQAGLDTETGMIASPGLGAGHHCAAKSVPVHPAGLDLSPETDFVGSACSQTERQGSNAAASTSSGAEEVHSGTARLAVQADTHGGTSQAWRQHKKHVFILSNAGKPIWTLHGEESSLAGLMAVIQALASFVHDKGDCMQSIRAGKHLIVFLERGPFILVMASATGELEATLMCQLGLVHAQILSILSSSVEKMFARNSSYDARKLLGATNHVLTSLVSSFGTDPSAMLACLVPLPLKSNLQHYGLVYLQAAVKSAGALFGVLLTQTAIVAVAQSRAHVLHPHDLLLLANLVRSNESFKQAQTFTPVCLPRFNSAAFLHAYVQFLHVGGGLCLVLLSSEAESFFKLADAAQEVHRQLKQCGVLQAIVSVTEHDDANGLLKIEDLPPHCGGGQVGVTPLLHFLYKSPTRGQVIMPAFAAPLDKLELQQVAMQRYATVHAAMTQKAGNAASSSKQPSSTSASYSSATSQQSLQQQVHWSSDGSMSALAYAGPEYELYALFDAMTDKETATRTCNRLSVWIKGQQADLFMPL